MSKAFIGGLCGSISTPPSFEPISKVVVMLDDENAYTAGDDTGREIRVPCPYGTQEMANKLLAQLSGYKYQPVSAEDALIDPAAELGDAITVGGVYTVYAEQDMEFDHMMAVDVSAPGEEELLPEYSYQSPMQQINYKIAKTRSLITKSTEGVLIKVEGTDGKGGLVGQVTALSVTLDGVTITDANGETRIKGSSIETGSITADKIATRSITTDKLVVGAIPTDTSQLTNGAGYQTATGVVSIVGGVVTADYIKALGVSATSLEGQYVTINSGGFTYGHMMMTTDAAGSRAFEIYGHGGMRLLSNGNVYINGSGATVLLQNSGVYVGPTLYLTNGTIIASDRDLKHDIEYDIEAYDAVFDGLKPSRFKYNDGTSDRYHTALIAQDVKEAVLSAGLTTKDFAGYCEVPVYAKDENGHQTDEVVGHSCALRYDEFIALNIRQIQLLKARVAELEAKL